MDEDVARRIEWFLLKVLARRGSGGGCFQTGVAHDSRLEHLRSRHY